MKFAILLSALICTQAQAVTIGAHLYSQHSTDTYVAHYTEGGTGHEKYNNANFGLYAIADNGFIAGAYRNSYRHNTVYAGWNWETRSYGPFKLSATAALATGYEVVHGFGKLRPMVMPSVVVAGPLGVAVRYSAAPAKGGVFQHISIERKF